MNSELHRDSQGHWVAPLPFRIPRSPLPNNKSQAINRAMMLDRSLKKNLKKQEHFMTFMEKVINNNHAEIAPPLQDEEECWYLPIFGVYHSRSHSSCIWFVCSVRRCVPQQHTTTLTLTVSYECFSVSGRNQLLLLLTSNRCSTASKLEKITGTISDSFGTRTITSIIN